MKIKIIEGNFNEKKYDKITLHPLQSWRWGEARKQMKIDVLRIGEFDNNQLANVYQLTFHKIPFTNFKIGYLPRSNFPSKKVLEFLYSYGRKNNVIFIKIEPYIPKKNFKFQISNSKLKLSPHPLFPQWTIIIDLKKSEDELLKRMKPKTRYNIRLAQKKGVVIKEMSNDEGFKIFSELYFQTTKRQKYFGHNLQYHKIVWNNLKNKIAYILIAYYDNTPLTAYQLWYFNNIAYYVYGGSSLKHKNLMASNLLMWETIKFSKKLGAKKFDMWGSLSPKYNPNHPWAGFTRFKEGYGGEFTEMIGSFDLIINPIFYQIFNFINLLRNAYLKLKRLI